LLSPGSSFITGTAQTIGESPSALVGFDDANLKVDGGWLC
jgi:hypothetical protein